MKELAILGFGLVGASLAAAVREADAAIKLVAIDVADVIASDAARSKVDELVDITDRVHLRTVVERADLCVLAAPVSVIAAELPKVLEWAQVVTDCGSTKRAICRAVTASPRQRRFVPSHPMAGGPEGGAEHARADLFRGQTWLVCPDGSDLDAVACVESLIRLVGAKSVHLPVAEHDRAVAYTSHAPQVLASALAVLTARANAGVAAGPAFRGTTRSAGGSESMWRDIFGTNGDEIGAVLRLLAAELTRAASGLEATPPDSSAALALLADARALR